MKFRYALLAAAMVMPAFAGTTTVTAPAEPAQKKLSGLISFGYETNYTGRGYVVSHTVAQGDSVLNSALKLHYDIGETGCWTLNSTIAYIIPVSGHTLYGEPKLGGNNIVALHPLYGPITGAQAGAMGQTIGYKNIENQFTVITDLKYTSPTEKWNVAFGHNFTHGGLLGVMNKHFRKRSFSNVNEFFIAPEWTPYKWLSLGMKTSYSFQGMEGGWWFEPYVTVKAPIIGTPDDLTLLGTATIGMSATHGYFKDSDHACANGTQAVWLKISTPWFVTKNFIVTPSISFNWLGNGGIKANKGSQAAAATGYAGNVPFRNFGVVAGISATYTF
ncbi:MAG: hypothetical protein Q4F38_09060 [Akkermansia sp.]|nr:hypothetical protein [Akkermansia sp.]